MKGFWIETKLESFINDAIKDIDLAEKKVRMQASNHLVKKMKEKVSDKYFKGSHSRAGEAPGVFTGNLKKGIGLKDNPNAHETQVGVGPPAYHAHLLEFGTVERPGKGRILPRPFVMPTFEEEKEVVGVILSQKWLT